MERFAPRVERVAVTSDDPEYAHDVWRRVYATDFTVRLSGSTEGFRFELVDASVPDIAIGRTSYSTAAEMDVPPLTDHFLAATHLRGWARLADGREEIVAEHGRPLLMPLDRGYRYVLSDVDVRTVSLSASAVDRAARSVLGPDAARPRFTSMVPVSAGAARYWHSVLDHLRDTVLADDEVAATPLVLAEATRSLAIAALLTFPNTTLDKLCRPDPPGWAEPAALRRALAYIEEHADEEIGVDDVAVAARIGVRGLQHLFRRHRDCTPLEQLRRVRMDRAHSDLSAGDPTRGDTVAAIAGRWGFTNPGRFSVQYRQAYGCSPGETLRR
jgi:AraC-like DNA-binding protein